MCKVYEFAANGTEEIEALTPVVALRRADIDTVLVSTTGGDRFVSSHNVEIKCDTRIEDIDCSDADMILLPGGLPGASNLMEHQRLREIILAHHAAGKKIGAICAAPMILGELGLLKGKRATCYPGFEQHLKGAEYDDKSPYVIDGDIITACGPAAAMPYALAVVEMLKGKAAADTLGEMVMYHRLGVK